MNAREIAGGEQASVDARSIPEDKINEEVARAQGWANSQDYPNLMRIPPSYITMEHDDCCRLHCSIELYAPLTDPIQLADLIKDPEIEAKMHDVLDEWLGKLEAYEDESIMGFADELEWVCYWNNPEYKANPVLWKLRAIVEVLSEQSI